MRAFRRPLATCARCTDPAVVLVMISGKRGRLLAVRYCWAHGSDVADRLVGL